MSIAAYCIYCAVLQLAPHYTTRERQRQIPTQLWYVWRFFNLIICHALVLGALAARPREFPLTTPAGFRQPDEQRKTGQPLGSVDSGSEK